MSFLTKSSQHAHRHLLNRSCKNFSRAASTTTISNNNSNSMPNVVIVDGVRLPFAMSSTIYADEMAVDLQRLAFKGLVDKTAIDRKDIDYVISGSVIQEVRTSNLAREAAVNAGFPIDIGGHTISMVSSVQTCVLVL